MTLAQRVARRTFRERIFLGLEAPAQAALGFAGIVAFLTTLFGVLFSDTVHVRAASAEVATAIYLAAAGVSIVPMTLLLVRRASGGETPLEGDEPHSSRTASIVLPGVALLSASAAVIHFVAIDQQSAGYWLFYLLFSLLSVFQLGWAMAVLIWPSRLLHVAGALVNAGTVAIWIWSRTIGLPFGPSAHMAEKIAFADSVATGEEFAIVAGVVWLLAASALRPPRARSAVATALALSLLLIAPTALSFISAVGTHLLVPPSD